MCDNEKKVFVKEFYKTVGDKEKAIVRLTGPVDKAIYEVCDTIDKFVDYYKYNEVDIELDSPGGSVAYLDHFFDRQKKWRDERVIINTVGLTNVASAAACILTLGTINGGQSFAYENSRILYHFSRIQNVDNITVRIAKELMKSLDEIDDKIIIKIITKQQENYNQNPNQNSINDKSQYKSMIDTLSKYLPRFSNFTQDEFNSHCTINNLVDALKNDRLVTGPTVDNTIDGLNNLLKNPSLYNNLILKKNSLTYILKYLKESYEVHKNNENILKSLNRAALEEFYPKETPKTKDVVIELIASLFGKEIYLTSSDAKSLYLINNVIA